MTDAVVIRKVETKADYKAFFEFPWVLFKDDPNWVAPLLSMRRTLLDQQKHPSWEYMEGDYFCAWRGSRLVGTIAALINHRHNEFHNEHIGWFGAFQVYDDQEAATKLLDTAADWVRSRGYDAIRGPQSFTTHEETGLLIDNFSRPILLMPYNYPYFQRLIESIPGWEKCMDVHSFYINRDRWLGDDTQTRIMRLAERAQKRSSFVVRPFDRRQKQAQFKVFKELYNAAWEKNWGFVPMTEKELDDLIKSLGMFFDPDISMMAYSTVHDEPIGFFLAIPDFNQVLQLASPRPGKPELISLLQALWHWKVRPKMTWFRVPLLGVREEYRRKGVDIALCAYGTQAMLKQPGRDNVDAGWILENNHDMVGSLRGMRMEIYKTYRFYEKRLTPES